jgi:hypothetical protein
MASSKKYLVTAALVVARDLDGRIQYYYRGSELQSDGLNSADVEHLVREGLIAEESSNVDEFLQPAVGVPPHEPLGGGDSVESEERHTASRRSASGK